MPDFRNERCVAFEIAKSGYPSAPPFNPDQQYPEYSGEIGGDRNEVYGAIRKLFMNLELDKENIGRQGWNPLGCIIKPGQQVLIKPNIVLHKNLAGSSVEAVITHGSVIRVVVDYVIKALGGTGRIVIGDAPIQQCDFEKATRVSGLWQVVEFYRSRNVRIDLMDFRLVTSAHSASGIRSAMSGDPEGYSHVDLDGASHHCSDCSAFSPTHYDITRDFDRFRVTNYDPDFMKRHHNKDKHEYIIANSALHADTLISIPKLKTHRKAGISINLKNMVGINGHKDCLPHHSKGSKEEGGDEYPRKSRLKRALTVIQEMEDVLEAPYARVFLKIPKRILYLLLRAVLRDGFYEGSWWGNDTLWRTVLDLNTIAYYWNVRAQRTGEEQQRQFLSIVDGVIAGEGEGPLEPTARKIGLVAAGQNPAAVDIACATVMGFDWRRIPLLRNALGLYADFAAEEILAVSSQAEFSGAVVGEGRQSYAFVPSKGWLGHIEV